MLMPDRSVVGDRSAGFSSQARLHWVLPRDMSEMPKKRGDRAHKMVENRGPRAASPGFTSSPARAAPVSSRSQPWRPMARPSSSAALCRQTSRSTWQRSRQPD
jgi:hypothetical protein